MRKESHDAWATCQPVKRIERPHSTTNGGPTYLSQRTSDRGARFTAAIAAAEVSAKLSKTMEATRALEAVRSEASHYGYAAPELEARLHLGEVEVRSGKASAGRAHLGQLRDDARNKGFLVVARKAGLP